MRAKKLVACALSAAMMLGLASMTGCGSAKKDYDLYIYNTKSEIADSIQDLCKDYETATLLRAIQGESVFLTSRIGDFKLDRKSVV